jgi:hypothetical protein
VRGTCSLFVANLATKKTDTEATRRSHPVSAECTQAVERGYGDCSLIGGDGKQENSTGPMNKTPASGSTSNNPTPVIMGTQVVRRNLSVLRESTTSRL